LLALVRVACKTSSIEFHIGLIAEVNAWVFGIDLGGGIDVQFTVGLQGPGGSNVITGANLASGAMSLVTGGSISAEAELSVWVGLPFFEDSATIFDIQVPIFSW
jgi:hypothetical protein